jgi:hypothetical protein
MAEELQLDSLKEITKADYIKAFKNKAVWKKAKAVIILVDYKLEGKKTTIAIPFKKEAEMKLEMKRLKKDKLHPMKKSGAGLITVENEGEEGMKAKVELLLGGLKPELLQVKGAPLFEKIKTTLEVLIAAGAELEASDPNEPVEAEDPNEEEKGEDAPEDNNDNTIEEKPVAGKKLSHEELAKIKDNMNKMKDALAKMKTQLNIS